MSPRRRLLLSILALGVVVVGTALYRQRERFAIQMACYRVGAATNYEAAIEELASFEQPPNRDAKLRALVARFGTGNPRFDRYLTQYAYDAQASDDFRRALSLEFGWRPEAIPLWGAAWRERKASVAEEITSVRRYLEALYVAEPPRELTWRDVLDIQAVFALTGQADLARRLTPDNWRGRYERWLAAEGQWTQPG